ncbi:hypothetical protein QE429_002142 [Bacillus sp. SORGH_AS 510]|uniref:hypothetical protein n=1 Tax=Bacillus sp. SORGH_AS_0510 TaxID=3041771 RepID=UPI0027802587|nr:hypothetical protein [Bacillus sp. SORGH_AS_0510]MDQ1145315.1 hypothetical protein [Bacillus sp. SORGH_AS_0510]
MKELVGTCKCCSKSIYCLEGFFNGVHTEENEIYCFDCFETILTKNENPQG